MLCFLARERIAELPLQFLIWIPPLLAGEGDRG
jgi:hypothetical protein